MIIKDNLIDRLVKIYSKIFIPSLILGCLFTFPFSRAIWDEILIGLWAVLKISSHGLQQFCLLVKSSCSADKVKFAFFAFLFTNSLYVSIVQGSIISIRWTIFFALAFLVTIPKFTEFGPTNDFDIEKLALFYTIALLLYFYVTRILGLAWEEMQTQFFTGPTYSFLPFALFLLIILRKYNGETLSKKQLAIVAFVLLNIEVYSSRWGYIVFACFVLLITIKTQKFMRRVIVLSTLLGLIFLVPAINPDSKVLSSLFERDAIDVQVQDRYLAHVNGTITQFEETLITPIHTRDSDLDRKKHITCGLSTWNKQEMNSKIFGIGSGNLRHNESMSSCLNGSTTKPIEILRSITFTAFLLEYGAVGMCLLMLLVGRIILNHLKNRNFHVLLLIFVPLFVAFFTFNYMEVLFIYWLALGSSSILENSDSET